MAEFKPTAAQDKAINTRGKNILVSASAGSGKTAVLVNRVIKLIKEGHDIDRMLLVTFTDAAAKNMRDKIRTALQEIAQDTRQPKAVRDRMTNQINRLAAADISTIHAFCLKLIKRYYYLINLDPQFRLLTDQTEQLLLEEDVWHQVSEQYYADADQEETGMASFRQLVLNFSSDRDDQGLDDLILKLYDVANAQADPVAWLQHLPKNYDLSAGDILETPFYQQRLKPVLVEQLRQFQHDEEEAIQQANQVGLDKDSAKVEQEKAALQQLIDQLNGGSDRDVRVVLQQVNFANFRGKPHDPDLLKDYQDLQKERNQLKKDWERLVKDYLGDNDDSKLIAKVQELQQQFGQLAQQAATLPQSQQVLVQDQQRLQVVLDVFKPVTWNSLRAAFNNLTFGSIPNKPKGATAEMLAAHETIKAIRKGIKERLAKVSEHFFVYDEEQLRTVSQHAQAILRKLSAVTQDFMAQYQQTKLNRHVLEFSDLEHYAYQILCPKDDDADWQALVANLQNHYQAIMVDEYQDTNQLQESILMRLAKQDAHNLFMVGDVKQSIYRFREADPSLFLNKYQRYQHAAGSTAIVLGENFRSMHNVTTFTNLLFSQLMDPEVGEIAYDQDAELKYAAHYYDDADKPKPVEIMLYDANARQQDKGTPRETDKQVGEFQMVGRRIKQLVEGHKQIYDADAKKMRPVQYGDIVILERTKAINNTLMEQFSKLDIPLTVHDVESYFQATEVRVMLALLKVIDNPHQDIPLVAVLRSPIVGLDNQELSFIRLQNQAADYYTALKTFIFNYQHHHKMRPYKNANELLKPADQQALYHKLTTLMNQLNQFRHTAQQETLVDLIWQIYQRTGYLDYVGAMRGGQQRQANLHALYQRAHTYEESSFKGLYQFIRFIEKMQEHDKDLGVAPSQLTANTVNVMTIHGSKGLQFPIVFLVDATHGFNDSAKRANAVVDAKAGVGIRWLDSDRVVYDTPQRQVAVDMISRSERAEDLRVLYVALTRAEQQLFITGSFNEEMRTQSLATSWTRWQKAFQSRGTVLSPQPRLEANSFMDWIGLALARYANADNHFTADKLTVGDVELTTSALAGNDQRAQEDAAADFTVQAYDAARLTSLTVVADQKDKKDDKESTTTTAAGSQTTSQNFAQILGYQYPHQTATETTAYQSVTDVKRVFEDDDPRLGQRDYAADTDEASPEDDKKKRSGIYINPDFAVPSFIQKDDAAPKATQIGTATHLVFQKLSLDQPVTPAVVRDEIADLTQQGLMTPATAAQIDVAGVASFFKTAVGQQILAHPTDYHREEPFAMIMNGHEPFADIAPDDNDQVLIHGIIDGYLVTNDGIILVDYKTDHLAPTPAAIKKVVQKYSGQLRLYAEALNIMRPIPVVQMGLYLVELREFVSIQGGDEKSGDH
jgi:ATP-dependent helicase/nuclease subunit A